MPDLKYFEVPNFLLQKGATLPLARIAYRTLGSLNTARDNAILVPSSFGTNDTTIEQTMLGKDRALDPGKYFIILPNGLGNGRSSSPSNTPEPFGRGRFPLVTHFDNVRLQHLLVREELGLNRLRMVAGWSMGATLAFQWGAQFPDMMESICPIAGAARTSQYNKVLIYSLMRALKLDPVFADGYYTRPPIAGVKALATIMAGWIFSEPGYRQELFRWFGAKDYKEWVNQFWEPMFLQCDANDLIAQLQMWLHADISDNPIYEGDFEAALAAIKAKAIIVPCDHDRYFPPVDSEFEASHMPNAECRTVNSIWGHLMPASPEGVAAVDAAISELLA